MNFWKTLAICGQLAWPAATAAQDAPQTLTITLTSYAFTPQALVLKAGVPAHLHLVNAAAKGHSFSAPEFFAEATLADGDQAQVRKGEIDLAAGQSADVTVTPMKPGTYALTCSHFMHTAMGMTGTITVQ